jgi:diguanylate cyclase (GGDEF)-like protein
MLDQKNYQFYNNQVIFIILLSLIPGLVITILAWMHQIVAGALFWFILLSLTSIWGIVLKFQYESRAMSSDELMQWYSKIKIFYYVVFSLWTLLFILYAGEVESNLHYIVIFTQLSSAVVASALLVIDRKIFVPILFILLLPLSIYFLYIDKLFGYVLAIFNMIFLGILLYASNNTYELIQKNDYQAKHDMLTGLYNRRYFLNYMERLIQRLAKSKKIAYLLLIDLDNFKIINDSLGHEIGDKVLQSVSRRIQNFTEDKHIVARFGGDEFTLLSLEYKKYEYTYEDAYDLAKDLLSILKEPYRINQHRLYLSASIGIKQITATSSDGNEFIKEADIAMYEAKNEGRDCIVLFNEHLAKRVQKHHEVEQKLHFAFKDRSIELYYQPLFNKHETVIGCEALVRWKDNDTFVSPDIFIPIAEKTGLIIDMGYYLLEEAFKTLVEWHKKGMSMEHFAINISVKQLLVDTFSDHVELLCDQYLSQNLREKVYFEVTESVLAEDVYRIIETMDKIKKLGIRFSMDDFGTGYSSLSHLKEIPIDQIKIDKSFVSYLSETDLDQTMVPAILSIAKLFDLSVVAEGVETKEQFDFLVEQGCDIFQGYYFNKAISKTDFISLYTK